MTEDIDIKKLTDDAFMAIDALFTDEDNDIFSEEKDKEPDDFDLIQEYMLAIEWECSDKNIKKFGDFINKLTPKYNGKHNQDILKMLSSILKYLEKAKDKAIPETHQVMEFIVKTFKHINQHGIDEATIKQEKNNAYNKVLDLKSKIAKLKAETTYSQEVYGAVESRQSKEQKAQLKSSAITMQSDQTANLQPATNLSSIHSVTHQHYPPIPAEPIENSPIIVSILTRLDFCENRLSAIDAQNTKLQQQIYELTNLNRQLNDQISDIELKFSEQINDLSQIIDSLSISTNSLTKPSGLVADFEQNIDTDNPSFANVYDDPKQYEEVSFDGLDFDDMDSDINQQSYYVENNKGREQSGVEINEVGLDEIDIGDIGLEETEFDNAISDEKKDSRFEIDFDNLNTDSMNLDSIEIENNIFESDEFNEVEDFETITSDDIEYDEITEDLIEYSEDNIKSQNIEVDNSSFDVKAKDSIELEKEPEKLKESGFDDSNKEQSKDNILDDNELPKSKEIFTNDLLKEVPHFVRCFKIEKQPIALPDDKIYNIYKIPSKLTKNISQMPILSLGEFSSLFQNLSKNMKGHLKDVSNSTLKKMNVDIHLLTDKSVQYKIAVLCSVEDKVSIIPFTDIYDNLNHPMTDIKNEHNDFSEYNVNIVDIGLIPFVHLSKK
ncbi:MAG: hypothetical protein HQK72_12280 [Desulfamplus sp.]|nr:hypothetical protein [Desulfamplus sp.]